MTLKKSQIKYNKIFGSNIRKEEKTKKWLYCNMGIPHSTRWVNVCSIPTSFQIVFVMRFKSSIDMGIYLEQTIKPWKVAALIKTRTLSFDKNWLSFKRNVLYICTCMIRCAIHLCMYTVYTKNKNTYFSVLWYAWMLLCFIYIFMKEIDCLGEHIIYSKEEASRSTSVYDKSDVKKLRIKKNNFIQKKI